MGIAYISCYWWRPKATPGGDFRAQAVFALMICILWTSIGEKDVFVLSIYPGAHLGVCLRRWRLAEYQRERDYANELGASAAERHLLACTRLHWPIGQETHQRHLDPDLWNGPTIGWNLQWVLSSIFVFSEFPLVRVTSRRGRSWSHCDASVSDADGEVSFSWP